MTTSAGFGPVSAEKWRALALAALRKSGAVPEGTTPEQVDELLATATHGGPRIAALHTAETTGQVSAGWPGQQPFVRGGRAAGSLLGGWDVRQRHAGAEPKAVREAILGDLENGATSLWLVLGDGGLPVGALAEALDGVHLDLAGVTLDAGVDVAAAAAAWFTLTAGLERTTGGLGADPLGLQARTGEPGDLRQAAVLAGRCVAEAPGTRAVTVDATVYHEAGGSEVEELACATAAGVAYLRALTGAGLSVTQALGQLEFRFAATTDQFATIAKLRAARRLWARVGELCGAPEAAGQRQHAVTSVAMLTVRDPWVNLLRSTIAAFAAGTGGADAVTVLPFDHQLGAPDEFSQRLARTTQTLLIEEAHVARVIDPAGGSWYVERRTEQLAQAAWQWFTTIEKAGGLPAALDSGLVGDRIAATWAQRADALAHRRDPITGVSEFPNLAEEPPRRRPVPAPVVTGGLPRRRYAEAFERLRDRSDAHLAATGERPAVRLVTLGSAAAHGQRLTFTTNLFAAGGIAVTTGDSDVVCLCGPDRDYTPTMVTDLGLDGVSRVLLAGKGDFPGVDGYLHVGCDAVAVLTTTLDDLGVAP
ncbi:methylmalonyl-CoA mutase subunit beta [Actinoplanes sp. NBRC 101535]|uniref:methylmalonyl-CoA mutase subunit beta n=1 Tax=Actinoplanes sp. NBRC 101535 TaxID=3032196 RepID=UPI0024A001AA|nr:methylmalonyl-CoA mutase subunit beta [Actinoplanes sp. NBRC 101535]GLY02183.1 methylmalonyl-CoA mutase [Actinoplanes sp. NBRC 101535]